MIYNGRDVARYVSTMSIKNQQIIIRAFLKIKRKKTPTEYNSLVYYALLLKGNSYGAIFRSPHKTKPTSLTCVRDRWESTLQKYNLFP